MVTQPFSQSPFRAGDGHEKMGSFLERELRMKSATVPTVIENLLIRKKIFRETF